LTVSRSVPQRPCIGVRGGDKRANDKRSRKRHFPDEQPHLAISHINVAFGQSSKQIDEEMRGRACPRLT
jgi:hypothetical protein